MALFSQNGVGSQLAVDADGNVILQRMAPNVSNFGWTTNDLKSVSDIVKWVDVAVDAANSASANASYVEAGIKHIDAVKVEVGQIKTDAQTIADNVLTSVTSKVTEANQAEAKAQAYMTAAFAAMAHTAKMYEAIKTAFPTVTLPDVGTAPTPVA